MTEVETDTVVSYKIVIAALTSTALISLAPNLILFLFPNYGKNGNNGSSSFVLSLGQALAAGGLLGDVFLHTLSHSHSHDHGHSSHGHDHSHDANDNNNNEETNQGLCILFGFTIFLIVDMIIRALGGGSCSHGGHSHSHNDESHSHNTHSHRPLENGDEHKKNKLTENGDTHINSKDATTTTKRWLTSTVLLNLVADSLHNFTDGIAIGASYGAATSHHNVNESFTSLLYSSSRGSLATLSILFHEIPHELGDFCILVQNGFTRNQAIMLQFTTAIAAMVGTIVGLLATTTASFMNGDVMIYATSGGFIYLATVTILPEMLNDNNTNTIKQRIFQLISFLIGIAFLYAVSLMEEHDHEHHDHSHSHDHGHDHSHHTHSHDHHDHEHDHNHGHHSHHQHEEL